MSISPEELKHWLLLIICLTSIALLFLIVLCKRLFFEGFSWKSLCVRLLCCEMDCRTPGHMMIILSVIVLLFIVIVIGSSLYIYYDR